jgi:hypothetical protein
MQKLIKAFENMMVAITFAESGEYDEARKIGGQDHETEGSLVGSPSEIKAAGKA